MKPLRYNIPWSISETEYLQLNYFDKTDEEIAIVLNRSAYAIRDYRYKLKLPARSKKRYREDKLAIKVAKMQELIKFCETSTNPYQIDKAKEQLRKLSGL